MYFLVRPLFIVLSIKSGVEERRILKFTSVDNRHILTAGVHKFQATKSCTMAFNICGPSIWDLFRVAFSPLHFWKIVHPYFTVKHTSERALGPHLFLQGGFR